MRLPGYDRELDAVAIAPMVSTASYVNGLIDPVNRIGEFGVGWGVLVYRRQGLTRAVLAGMFVSNAGAWMDWAYVCTVILNFSRNPKLYESVELKVEEYC